MGKNRRKGNLTRKENTRELRKSTENKNKITFSFKDIDFTQPKGNRQNFKSWQKEGILSELFTKMKDISELTLDEAKGQNSSKGHITVYGDFPEKSKFTHPKHVNKTVCWAVLNNIGGQIPRVAGYIDGTTFYVVFLDKDHEFWPSKMKNT